MSLEKDILKHVRNVPLRELERQTGIAASTLSRALSGERGLSAAAMERLAEHFGLELKPKKAMNRKLS